MGCQVNETENNGYHPLHIAIKKGYDDIAQELIQHKADIQFRDRSGYDPFELEKGMNIRTHNVHVYEEGNPEINRYLKFRNWMRSHER